ncbi:PREDICTED: uncharacterized protein At4g22758 [Ipomoea nil]|uniref:uncharacterized protein At4g22758 n=1 Tax=Ipomoea nil TaxID=35883 RepID=UPI000901EC0E|nr:PREDICTED: uncharacterized protein At4g22758 [Ipomoea nil]
MSERELRRRIPVSRIVRSRAPHRSSLSPSPSPLGHRRSRPVPVPVRRRSSKQPLIRALKRCGSEPLLPSAASSPDDGGWNLTPPQQEVLFRPHTCTDIFSTPDYFVKISPANHHFPGYNKESKVVVNVTFEGCPGPVRTMVKLGTSVDETIRLAINKYSEEGRSPHLNTNGVSSFDLYQSNFSLQSLSKSELIGDVGSRSFYLRKSSKNMSRGEVSTTSLNSDSDEYVSLAEFFSRKINKILRRSGKLCQFFGCFQC